MLSRLVLGWTLVLSTSDRDDEVVVEEVVFSSYFSSVSILAGSFWLFLFVLAIRSIILII